MAVDAGAWTLEPEPDLVLACALKKEAAALGRYLPGLSIIVTGFGSKNTGEKLDQLFSERPSTRLLLFTGAAGGLDPSIRLGDILCPECWRTEDGVCVHLAPQLLDELRLCGWEASGAALTVARPALRVASRRRIFEKTGARACDMEAAEALQVAARHAVPALAIKVVTDTVDSNVFAFWRHFDQNMKLLADRLASLWPTLVKLARGQGL